MKKSGHFFSGDELTIFDVEVFNEIALNFDKLDRNQSEKNRKAQEARSKRRR